MTLPDLQGVAHTLLVPLACRALESPRPDAIIHDPRAVEVYNHLGGNRDFLLGMSGHDLFASVMRVRRERPTAACWASRLRMGLRELGRRCRSCI